LVEKSQKNRPYNTKCWERRIVFGDRPYNLFREESNVKELRTPQPRRSSRIALGNPAERSYA
jgi:hypothetical protein